MAERRVQKQEKRHKRGSRGQSRRDRRVPGPLKLAFDADALLAKVDTVLDTVRDATAVEQVEAGWTLALDGRGETALLPKSDATGVEKGQSLRVYVEKADTGLVASQRKAALLDQVGAVQTAAAQGGRLPGVVVADVRGGYSVAVGATSRADAEAGNGLRAFMPMSQSSLGRAHELEVLDQSGDVKVTEFDGARCDIVVSRRAVLRAERKAQEKAILAALAEGQEVDGVVRSLTTYGAFVDIGGIDALLHVSDLSWDRQPRVSDVLRVGQTIKAKVLSVDTKSRKVKIGAKQLTEDPWAGVSEAITVGADVTGDVVALTDFGAFVRVQSGVEGLIHVSEISWKRVKHPSVKLSIGQTVTARVLGVDTKARRLSLSTRALEDSPVEKLMARFEVGSVLKTKVVRVADFGIFVELDDGVDALVHIGELTWTKRVEHPSEVVAEGDDVEVVVTGFDVERQRVSASMKRVQDDPWQAWADTYKPGTVHSFTVQRVENAGVHFVVEDGLTAFCRTRDLGGEDGARAKDLVRDGEQVELMVTEFDRARQQLKVSRRAVQEAETRDAYQAYLDGQGDESASRMTLGDQLKGQFSQD